MSTFFATFENLATARRYVDELLGSGVRPDDVSVVSRESSPSEQGTVGDATAIVGRADDPDLGDGIPQQNKNVADLTTTHGSPIGGIDTTNRATDVDSVDQSDDSQSLSEDMAYPPRETSQSTHEADDLALTVRTGFPTTVPLQDDVIDSEGPLQQQMSDSLQVISFNGHGTVMGEGALATAALDVINPEHSVDAGSLIRFFVDEGVPTDCADGYVRALDENRSLVAIGIAPGAVAEPMVEDAATRWGALESGMFDAPRFYDQSKGEGYVA